MAHQSGFSAYLSADQLIADTTATVVEFDRVEEDIQGEFNMGTYTFTAGTTGIYQVSCVVMFLDLIVDGKSAQLQIQKNAGLYTEVKSAVGSNANPGLCLSLRIPLVATDTIRIVVYHDHGAARNIDDTRCRFSIAKIA